MRGAAEGGSFCGSLRGRRERALDPVGLQDDFAKTRTLLKKTRTRDWVQAMELYAQTIRLITFEMVQKPLHVAEGPFPVLQLYQLDIGEPGSNAALRLCVNYGLPFISIADRPRSGN